MRLYINIDHVATLRQARGEHDPDPIAAALLCERAGADGITVHLREDRRHIQDDDLDQLATSISTVLNLEMACTEEMLTIAERLRPHQATLVSERRQEVTTEGGLDVSHDPDRLREGIARLNSAGIKTSLFVDPTLEAVERSRALGAVAVELHTGPYAHAPRDPGTLRALSAATERGVTFGLAVHAGHGLTVANVGPVAAITDIQELSIGHSVVARALFVGLADAVRELRVAMDSARSAS